MAATAEESNPPDLLSSVSIDPSTNSEHDRDSENDQVSVLNIRDADLVYKINSLHCPFVWKPEDSLTSYNQDSVEEIMNVDEVFAEPSGFKLRKYVIHLILCYNSFGKRLLEKCLKHLDEMEKMLLTSMKNRSQDAYFVQINEALFHILHSCRVVMLHTTNQKEKAHKLLQRITPYEKLNDTNKAGIWAVRANLYVEFGYEGIKAAIQFIERSTEIDKNNSYWHFMRGMYLGRLRRMESVLTIPSMDEIASLECAMKLKEDAAFMAFAAEVYVETASRTKKSSQQMLIPDEHQRRKIEQKNDLINERAAMLFKKSVSLNRNNAHLLFRCGKGMLKLNPPYQDVCLALEYLNRGLELAYESSFGNHAMALYYMKHKEDYDMARKYLVKATESKNFGADIDLIRVDFLINRDPEALLDSLLKLFDRYDDKMKHEKILAEIESYYLFIKYNLMEAINYMNKLLYLVGDHDDIISVFKSGILRQRFPVSLLEILLSDISDRSNKDSLNAEEQEECRKFMQRLCMDNITLPRPKKENLRKKVLNDIKANLKDIDLRKAKRSPPNTEKQPRKDYNPAEGRFEKEYAKKYYAGDESTSKYQRTVVDEFFEKYEAAADFKSKVEKTERSHMNRDNSSGDANAKSKDGGKFHPVLQQLFDKVNKSSNHDSDKDEKEIMDKLARQLDLHFSFSARAGISKQTSRSSNINVGASTSSQRDHFDSSEIHRRRSSRSPKRRSTSTESYRAGKESSHRRSDSRGSYRSAKQSHRKRSPSVESRHSGRRRTVSRDRRSRTMSRDRRSHMNRSFSRERSITPRNEKLSPRKRSRSRDHQKSSRRRSMSKDNKYSTRSNRVRSTSRGSRKSSKSRRRRSISKETKYSSKSNRPRSTSRETGGDRKSERKRSVSKETKYSTRSNRRGRSVSKETKYSTRSNRPRSTSRETREDRKSYRKRSNSRESKYSVRSSRRKSPSRERSPAENERRRSRDRRSASVELRKRSQSKESRYSKVSTHKRRSPSTESRKPSRRQKRSPSEESLRSSKSKHSRRERSPSEKRHDRRSQADGSNSKTIPKSSDKAIPAKTRSRSRESRYSSKHSPRPERNERSEKSKKYESDDTLTESSSDTDFDKNESKKSHRRDSHQDYRRNDRRRSYSSEETQSVRSKRSSSTEKSRSKRIPSRDRRDHYRPKDRDRRYRRRDSSEGNSSDRSSKFSREVDIDKRYSRHRKRVVSSRSRSVEKNDDKIRSDESDQNKDS